MCEKRRVLFESENQDLGKFKIFETKNKARKYIVSEKFGTISMQGKKYQQVIVDLMSEKKESIIEEKSNKNKNFWGFSNE